MRTTTAKWIAMGLLLASGWAEAKSVRATEMTGALWSDMSRGTLNDVIVEFRQGDELPVTLNAQGDLIETTQTATSYIGVKKNFWLRMQRSQVQISLDGTNFKDLRQVLTGTLEAGAGADQSGGVANAINVIFKAFLK